MRNGQLPMSIENTGRFGSVIMCEDIRREDNGKLILIGVYSSNVMLQTIPGTFVLRPFVNFQASRLGSMRLDFEFRIGDRMVAEVRGTVNQERRDDERPEYISMILPSVPINVSEACTLDFVAISDDGEGIIYSLAVSRAEGSSTISVE